MKRQAGYLLQVWWFPMKSYKYIFLFIIALAVVFSNTHETKKLTNLQFITGMNGEKILSSMDTISNDDYGFRGLSLFRFGKKKQIKDVLTNQLNEENPELANLWNSTSMVFGAAADGVGIGTSFALKKLVDGKMLLVTNFHVIENFCTIPEGVDYDLVEANNLKYPCQALFILHDIAINIHTNTASADGAHPWKSEVVSLDYFDKQRDLAAFRINLPENSNVTAAKIETNYDLKNLLVERKQALKINPQLPPILEKELEVSPLAAFTLYLPAFSVPKDGSVIIQKQWFKGLLEGTRIYENEKKLGFVTALKHNIEVLPGSSGAPLALSDGRIIGVNTSVETKQFYARKGILWWAKERLETYNSFFAMPVTFVKDFIEKIN